MLSASVGDIGAGKEAQHTLQENLAHLSWFPMDSVPELRKPAQRAGPEITAPERTKHKVASPPVSPSSARLPTLDK